MIFDDSFLYQLRCGKCAKILYRTFAKEPWPEYFLYRKFICRDCEKKLMSKYR